MSSQKLIQQGAEARIFLVKPAKTITPRLKKVSSNLEDLSALTTSQLNALTKSGTKQINSYEQSEEQYIIKSRIPKSYRIKILDDKIRKQRTKSETKLLIKASQIINVPIPIINNSQGVGERLRFDKFENDKNKSQARVGVGTLDNNFQILLPFIYGKKLSQHLDEFSPEKQKQILKQIGKDIAKLHDENIIHGDLTTSNMILVEDIDNYNSIKQINNSSKEKEVISNISLRSGRVEIINKNNFKIFFIDFGLGFFNGKFEDKAVDIHLLKQALESKHFLHWQENYKSFLDGYKNSENYEKTINQLIKVEKRGRYRH